MVWFKLKIEHVRCGLGPGLEEGWSVPQVNRFKQVHVLSHKAYGQTDTTENITFPQLPLWLVITFDRCIGSFFRVSKRKIIPHSACKELRMAGPTRGPDAAFS